MAGEDVAPIDPRIPLFEKLYADPQSGPVIDDLIKRQFPQAHIPRHEVRQVAGSTIEEIRKEREALAAERQKDRDERALERARAEAVAAGVQPSEIPEVEKLMQERGILRHTDAARLLEMERQVASPRSAPDTGWDVPGHRGAGGDFYKGIIGPDGKSNPRWAREKAFEVIAELDAARGGRR